MRTQAAWKLGEGASTQRRRCFSANNGDFLWITHKYASLSPGLYYCRATANFTLPAESAKFEAVSADQVNRLRRAFLSRRSKSFPPQICPGAAYSSVGRLPSDYGTQQRLGVCTAARRNGRRFPTIWSFSQHKPTISTTYATLCYAHPQSSCRGGVRWRSPPPAPWSVFAS